MVSPVLALDEGDAAKFPAPDDQRFVEESAAFEVLNQCPDGLVDDEGILGVAVAEAPVLVPGVAATEARGATWESSMKRTPPSTRRRASRHWRA